MLSCLVGLRDRAQVVGLGPRDRAISLALRSPLREKVVSLDPLPFGTYLGTGTVVWVGGEGNKRLQALSRKGV